LKLQGNTNFSDTEASSHTLIEAISFLFKSKILDILNLRFVQISSSDVIIAEHTLHPLSQLHEFVTWNISKSPGGVLIHAEWMLADFPSLCGQTRPKPFWLGFSLL